MQDLRADGFLQEVYWHVSCCPFCQEKVLFKGHSQKEMGIPDPASQYSLVGVEAEPDEVIIGGEYTTTNECPLCGWTYEHVESFHFGLQGDFFYGSILREIDLDSSEVTIAELATYLKTNFSDIYAISPERFEYLVEDILKAHGQQVVRTLHSWDRGADVILFTKDGSSIEGIVECKRYASHRKIGVELVRKLIGAAIDWDVSQVMLVTSSAFTSGAKTLAQRLRQKGYRIDLIDASELLALLKVYNEKLPPLHKMDFTARRELVLKNQNKQKEGV